jgi:hypothetical protein
LAAEGTFVARRALIVGINTYGSGNNLNACVADTQAMAEVLSRHKDGKKNFDCIVLLDRMEDGSPITRPKLRAALNELFNFEGEVLLYFSGHPAKGKGGTADVLAYTIRRRVPLIHIDPVSRTVRQQPSIP